MSSHTHSAQPGPDGKPLFTARSLLVRLALVAAVFMLANLSLGTLLDYTRLRCVNRESGLINNARREKSDVIILGSSRAKHHYDPKLLASLWGVSVYNAGFPGQAIPFNRVTFDLIAAKHHPKAVIVDVMAFDDDMDRVHAFDAWYFDSKVLREMPSEAEAGKAASVSPDFRIRCWMSFAAYRYADRVSRNLFDKPHQGEGPEFDPLPVGYVEKNWRGYEKPQPHKKFPWYRPQLAALVDEIKATGAEVVLAFSPTFKMGNETDFTDTAEAVAKEKGVPFIDFTKTALTRPEDKKYYYDGGHLNTDGAAIYTREVAVALRPLLPRTLSGKPADQLR